MYVCMYVCMSESRSCNPGSQLSSWLTKSCFPNNSSFLRVDNPIPIALLNTTTTISSLPDDLLLEILSRLPTHPISISLVCRRWSHLLHSPAFHHHRRLHHRLSLALFALSLSPSSLLVSSHLFTLLHSPWTTLTKPKPSFHTHSLSLNYLSHARLVSVGPLVYIITSRTTMFAYNTWNHSVAARPGMQHTRKKFAATVVNGKIYISGGACRTNTVDEYDPHAQTWQVLSLAPRKRYGCIGASVDGVFYIIGGLKIGACESSAVPAAQANGYPSSMDLYDVEAREWLRSQAVPGGGCVVAACGSGMYLYVLASHAYELSFWRFNGCRISEKYKEWCRIKAPPLPAQVRLDRSVKFSCIGMGDKVILVQVMGCIDDLLTRGGRNTRGYKDGLVLVFDSATEEWSRAADLPEGITRAAVVSVEC